MKNIIKPTTLSVDFDNKTLFEYAKKGEVDKFKNYIESMDFIDVNMYDDLRNYLIH